MRTKGAFLRTQPFDTFRKGVLRLQQSLIVPILPIRSIHKDFEMICTVLLLLWSWL